MANLITLSRLPILFGFVAILYFGSPALRWWGIALVIVILLLDTVDGMVARSRGEESLLGSVLDIAADRTVEVVLWVVFADLDLIPIALPLIMITRGISVDAVRAVGASRGLAPFLQVRSRLSRFLVRSSFMRSSYAVVKTAAFIILAIDYNLAAEGAAAAVAVHALALTLSWMAVAFSLARGLPVLVEGALGLQGQAEESVDEPPETAPAPSRNPERVTSTSPG